LDRTAQRRPGEAETGGGSAYPDHHVAGRALAAPAQDTLQYVIAINPFTNWKKDLQIQGG